MNEEKSYSIAGLNVKITGGRTVRTIGRLPGFGIFETDTFHETDVNIRVDEGINLDRLPGINPVHNFSVLDIGHYLYTFSDGYFFEMRRRDGSPIVSMVYDTCLNEVAMSSCDCELSLGFAVWVAYSFVAVGKDIVPVHASAIVNNGYGVLFLGESGTGKSTHTRLWTKHIGGSYLLNDDCPIVRFDGCKLLAYGSPWSGKTHCYHQEAVPVKAMVRLHQGAQNIIGRLGKLESIGAIYPSCPPLFAYDNMLAGKMAGTVGKIVTHAPIYSLGCLPDQEAAEIAYHSIYSIIRV